MGYKPALIASLPAGKASSSFSTLGPPARRLAGISKREFIEELGKRKIERHYIMVALEEDVGFAKGNIF